MPLAHPPAAAAALAGFPAIALAGRQLHRVWRYELSDGTTRELPWYFASTPAAASDGGRFDLPAALGGTCYLANDPTTAVLEALQARLRCLPMAELQVRRRVEIQAPNDAPDAADATDPAATGFGVTAGLWADSDRARSQAWAAAFRRDGWWALHTGASHEVTGAGRTVALFDLSGEHPPTGQHWQTSPPIRLGDDTELLQALAQRGCRPVGPGNLPSAPDPGEEAPKWSPPGTVAP